MIITLTLNPAVDRTVILDELVEGDTNRVLESRTDPGGKGINVSRVLHELGRESLAMGFVSGGLGRFIEHTLNDMGIFDDFIHTPGQTRINLTIIDLNKDIQTTINERGPETDPRYVTQLYHRMKKYLRSENWLVIAGSIPPPIKPGIYAELVTFAKERGVFTVLDADGEALALGLKAKPYMVKLNRSELQRFLGGELHEEKAIKETAEGLHASGIEVVVISFGADGCIGVNSEGEWQAVPPKVKAVSAVGAGDALMAGVVLTLSSGGSLGEALRLGTAAAVATALTPGTQLCRNDDVKRLLPQVAVSKL